MVRPHTLLFCAAALSSGVVARLAPPVRYLNLTSSASSQSSSGAPAESSSSIPLAPKKSTGAESSGGRGRAAASSSFSTASSTSSYPSSNTTSSSTSSWTSLTITSAAPTSTLPTLNGTTTTPDGDATTGSTSTQPSTSSDCISLTGREPVTVYEFAPNTTTLTLPYGSNATKTPEFTPTPYCCTEDCTTSATEGGTAATSSVVVPSWIPYFTFPRVTTTVIVTLKNPVTVYTTNTLPDYSSKVSAKQTVALTAIPLPILPTFPVAKPFSTTASPSAPVATSKGGSGSAASATTVTAAGVPIVLKATNVVIGGQTVAVGNDAPPTTVVTNGQTFTVNPSQVIAPGTVIDIPSSDGGIFEPNPTTSAQQTAVLILGGDVFSAIGSTIAVIGSKTITYGAGIPVTTEVFNGETLTIGPSGIVQPSTTIGGPSLSAGTQIGIAGGLSVTEIGSSIIVIQSTTFTIGPGAKSTVVIIDGETITADSSDIDIGTLTTLQYPLNPTTQAVTAGGITFSEIGTSRVVIGGTTYTVGSGAKTTTKTFNGETISIGPDGVGFKTTTVLPSTAVATGTSTKNGIGKLDPAMGFCMGLFMALGVGLMI